QARLTVRLLAPADPGDVGRQCQVAGRLFPDVVEGVLGPPHVVTAAGHSISLGGRVKRDGTGDQDSAHGAAGLSNAERSHVRVGPWPLARGGAGEAEYRDAERDPKGLHRWLLCSYGAVVQTFTNRTSRDCSVVKYRELFPWAAGVSPHQSATRFRE